MREEFKIVIVMFLRPDDIYRVIEKYIATFVRNVQSFLILGTYWKQSFETVPYKITSWAIFSPFLNFIIPHTTYHKKTKKNRSRK